MMKNIHVHLAGQQNEEVLDLLWSAWYTLNGSVLVNEVRETSYDSKEAVLIESIKHFRESSRLLWVVVDWAIDHHFEVDWAQVFPKLEKADLPVFGVFCSLVCGRVTCLPLEELMKKCKPAGQQEVFFHRVAASKIASKYTKDEALPLYLHWNFLCNEIRYLRDKPALSLNVT